MQCFQCPALRSGRLASRRAARILAMQHQQQASITKLRRTAVPLYPPLSSSPGFKVVQWNILADGLAQSGDFVKVSLSTSDPFARPDVNYLRSVHCLRYGCILMLVLCPAGSSLVLGMGAQVTTCATRAARGRCGHCVRAGTEPLW